MVVFRTAVSGLDDGSQVIDCLFGRNRDLFSPSATTFNTSPWPSPPLVRTRANTSRFRHGTLRPRMTIPSSFSADSLSVFAWALLFPSHNLAVSKQNLMLLHSGASPFFLGRKALLRISGTEVCTILKFNPHGKKLLINTGMQLLSLLTASCI